MIQLLINVRALLFIASVALMTGCGGGGGSDPAPTGSSDWDSMKWDQDKWK